MKLVRHIKEIKEGLVLAAAISFMLCVYAPIELFLSSQDDFWFGMSTLVEVALAMFALVFIILVAGLAVLRLIGRIPYNIGLCIGAAGMLICYLQGNFLVSGIPALDGTNFDWSAPSAERIKSIAVCIVVFAALIFILLKFKDVIFKKTVLIGSTVLSLLLAVTLTTLCFTTEIVVKDNDLEATGYNDFVYSEDKNLIMLIVDATDSTRFREALAANPEFGDTFDDFTYYDDVTTMYPFTLNAIPSMLSGVWNENQTSYRQYVEDAFDRSPLFNYLRGEDYRMGLYNKSEIILTNAYEGVFENQVKVKPKFVSPIAAATAIVKMSAIRYAPWDLKSFGYNLNEHLEDSMYKENNPVKKNNQTFYNALTESDPITVVEEKCARILHIEGAHVPFRYDKSVNLKEDATYMDNVECTLTVCAKFLERLKENNVYNNSVIIILGDHGYDDTLKAGLEARVNPVLLVKGINDKGQEMTVDSTPISYESVADAFTKLLKGEETTQTVFDNYSYPDGRRYLKYDYTKEHHMEEYFVYGRADDFDNIKPSGKVYELTE